MGLGLSVLMCLQVYQEKAVELAKNVRYQGVQTNMRSLGDQPAYGTL